MRVARRSLRRQLFLLALVAELVPACAPRRDEPLELDGDSLTVGFDDVRQELGVRKPTLDSFTSNGPLRTRILENQSVAVAGGETVVFDEATPFNDMPAPLVVLVHGNRSRKEAHRNQLAHLASFGMHAVALQLPNTDRWLANGRTIRRFIAAVRTSKRVLAGPIDRRNIVLVGHSFGGSAVTMAAATKGPRTPDIRGLILLDPAVVSPEVERAMAAVKVPVLLIGADPQVFRARRRSLFFQKLAGQVTELTVAGATHDDAQNPSMYSIGALGFDPFTSRTRQQTFTAALTLGAFSLAATGGLDYTWDATRVAAARGALKDAKRRASLAAEGVADE